MSKQHIHPGLIARLALADLKHEWVLTVCLILAVAAVLSPLLLLFGLKYGTIETLRQRLVHDPKNREIRPLASSTFNRDWFDEMRSRPDVGFVVPLTRQISATLRARLDDGQWKDLDLVPTGPNDPLLIDNGSATPTTGTCVLSHYAAEELGAKLGNKLQIEVSRSRRNRREKAGTTFTVAGVLPLRASVMKHIFTPLPMLEAVEAYKDGLAVPELGWKGSAPVAYPRYDGALILTKDPLSRLTARRLCGNTGFTRQEQLDAKTFRALAGFELPEGQSALRIYTARSPVGENSIRNVHNLLRGRDATLMPWIRPFDATLDGQPIQIAAYPQKLDPPIELPHITAGGDRQLQITHPEHPLKLPVTVSGEGDTFFVDPELAGVFRLSHERPINYEAASGELLLSRRAYAGFRMYAKDLEDVDTLRKYFEQRELPVHTAAEQIRIVLEMDRYLTLIFWLIAAVGISGCAASLLASLYASVERKKRELSVLRLIGLTGPTLYRFPIYQGCLISGLGFGLAWSLFKLFGHVINTLFADHLQQGEQFCHLPPRECLLALAGTVLLAALAATAAVMRMARIEPAEALRDE